jgi:hypothetical protein
VAQPSLEEAIDVIENGPPRGLSPRAQAASVRKAGEKMKSALREIEGSGEDRRVEAEELISRQEDKALVPKIFQLIHEAIPKPAGALGQATTTKELLEAIAAVNVPRAQRKQLFLKSLDIQYLQDINEYIWPDSLIPTKPGIKDPTSEQAGFKVTIVCTTPNQDGRRFVGETFMKTLRETGQQPGMGFFIDRVSLIEGVRLESTEESAPSGASSPDTLDPLTNEPVQQDWQFEIWADVILEDYPEPEEGEDEGE